MASRRSPNYAGPNSQSVTRVLENADTAAIRKQLQSWSNMPSTTTQAAEFRKLEMPRAAALLIQKFPNDDVLAAYAARLADMSIVPIPVSGEEAVQMDPKIVASFIQQVPDFWNLVATRLARPAATWAEKYSWCSILTQMILSHHFPLADFLAARPAILGTLASSLRLTGEDMNKSFKQIKDYPFDIVAYRFALPPTEAARASKMGLVYAEACRQIVSDVVAKIVRQLASRLSSPQLFLEAVKSSPNMIVDLVDVVVREPVVKNLPQSMCTSICASTVAVLMHIPFRETEEIDQQTRGFSISAVTAERLNFLLSHESDWLSKVLAFLEPKPVDYFDTVARGAITNLGEIACSFYALLAFVSAFEPAMDKYSNRLLNTFRGSLTRTFADQARPQLSRTRLEYLTHQFLIKNVYDEKGNVVVVTTLSDATSCCFIGLGRLIRHKRCTFSDLESVRPVEELRKYVLTSTKEIKDHGNEKYEEAMRWNKQLLEQAVASYTAAIALAMPDDPDKHIYYSNRAQAFLERGLYEEAALDCRHALSLNPHHTKSQTRLALALEHINRGKAQ